MSKVRLLSGCRVPAAWLLALLLGVLTLAGHAQQVPPRPNPPRLVNDLAGVLQASQAQALEQKLVAYNDSTSSQLAVVIVPNLGGADIFDYAQKLYQTWGIGQKGSNNGVLLLIAIEERQARIHTGSGLEGAVPDALAKRIISNTLAPAFRQQQYYQGLDQATDELIALAKGEYKADPNTPPSQRSRRSRSGSSVIFWVVIGFLILVVLFRNRGGGGGRRGGIGGGFIPPIIFGDFSGGRGTFGGWGGGGGGGGGFGGFGGGSSGGGGASGSW